VTIEASGRGIALFAGKVLAIGAALFAAWYFLGKPVSVASGWTAAKLLTWTMPLDGVRVAYKDRQLTFGLLPDDRTTRRNRVAMDAVVDVPANPLKYTFGVPFVLALILATRPAGWGWKSVAGAAVMIAIAGIGLYCEVLRDMSGLRGPGNEPFFAIGRAALELNALGYQLASLILPTVVPVVLWAAFDPVTIRVLRTA
jgi:hypothetical protein